MKKSKPKAKAKLTQENLLLHLKQLVIDTGLKEIIVQDSEGRNIILYEDKVMMEIKYEDLKPFDIICLSSLVIDKTINK